MQGIDKTMLGLEVAPWSAPLVPRAEGYNSLILDVFDRNTLIDRAKHDPNQVGRDLSVLEEVDFVGSATEVSSLVPRAMHGTFDYILSSHNFEHLSNPIKFLQGCCSVLKHDGLLVMAVPDRRHCFDYFRSNTTIGDWLDAFAEDRSRPNRRQQFDHLNHHANRFAEGIDSSAIVPGVRPNEASVVTDLRKIYRGRYKMADDDRYHDVHCTVMTPASAELLLRETRELGLIDLEVAGIGPSNGEFVIRIRKSAPESRAPTDDFNAVRSALLRRLLDEYIEQASEPEPEPEPPPPVDPPPRPAHKRLARYLRSFGRSLRGRDG